MTIGKGVKWRYMSDWAGGASKGKTFILILKRFLFF